MNKIIILFITLSIYLINYNTQAIGLLPVILTPAQLEAAKDLFYQVNGYNTTDPCQFNPYCTIECYSDAHFSYVRSIALSPPHNANPIIDSDFTLYGNITYFVIKTGVTVKSFFSRLPISANTYSIKIGSQKELIDNVVLSTSVRSVEFDNIYVPIPENFFASPSLTRLNIGNVFDSFAFPIEISTPLFAKSLQKLDFARFNIKNDQTQPGYISYELPSFSFDNVRVLYINFESQDLVKLVQKTNEDVPLSTRYQLWEFNQSLNNPSISELGLYGVGFLLPSSGSVDLSNLHIGANIYIEDPGHFINNCTTKPCIKTPHNGTLTISSASTDVQLFDLSNLSLFEYTNGLRTGYLLPTGINIHKLERLYLNDNAFTGSVPQEYCAFHNNHLDLRDNELTDLPSCFKCYGGNPKGLAFDLLFPNVFTDFNSNSKPTECSTFNINMDYNRIATTDGRTIITIYGTDFGWNVESGPNEDFIAQTLDAFEAPMMNITIPNYELALSIPQGVGANLSYTFLFGFNSSFSVTFNYSYEVPSITGYILVEPFKNGTIAMIVDGTGFDYHKGNILNINGVDTVASAADPSFTFSGVYFLPSATDLTPGNKMEIFAIVGGQTSNTVKFTIFAQLSLSKPNSTLSSNGGSLTLSGNFTGVSQTSDISVKINGVAATVVSVNSTSITITYPAAEKGIYPIVVSIGGQLLSSNVEYIQSDPTPTTTTTSSLSSSESDGPNTSSTLSISFTIAISCLIFSLFL